MLEETARTNPVMLSEDAPICHNQTNDIKKYLLMKLTKESQGQDVQFDPLTLVDTSHTTLWLENHDSKSKKRVVLSMKIEALIVDVKGEGRRDHGILME